MSDCSANTGVLYRTACCGVKAGRNPPDAVQVHALLSGFTADNQPFALVPMSNGSNVYQGSLNINSQFPVWGLSPARI